MLKQNQFIDSHHFDPFLGHRYDHIKNYFHIILSFNYITLQSYTLIPYHILSYHTCEKTYQSSVPINLN